MCVISGLYSHRQYSLCEQIAVVPAHIPLTPNQISIVSQEQEAESSLTLLKREASKIWEYLKRLFYGG